MAGFRSVFRIYQIYNSSIQIPLIYIKAQGSYKTTLIGDFILKITLF